MNTTFFRHACRSSHRCAGNTLVLALGVLTVVVATIMASSLGATSTLSSAKEGEDRLKVLAAVEAVLGRHERTLLDRAEQGILADFGTKDLPLAVDNNYGLDVVGNCTVRWKIEPCHTATRGNAPYIINPPPSGVVDIPSSTGVRQANDINFMFRISAEAVLRKNPNDDPIAIAQGARYAVTVNVPLFRFVIFYAQTGANGDLEFSHDPEVKIQGNIHSNGAIYIGSGTWVNHWGAAAGPSGSTLLGPDSDNQPVSITGVDGIFCLSKPLMFGALNRYPMGGTAPTWYEDWNWRSVYAPLSDAYVTPRQGMTYTINPRGIRDAAGVNTNLYGSTGAARKINSDNIYSSTSVGGNDARDGDGSLPLRNWNDNALTWFAQKARTSAIGGRKIPLSLGANVDANSRPFEPVSLNKHQDPQAGSDIPEKSTPVIANGVETPGYFFGKAIGGLFQQNMFGTGGSVIPTVPAPATFGLAIRERPIPDTNLWPGAGNPLPPMSPLNPNYMPFAYGKHWYPTHMPFYPLWVTQGTGSSSNSPKFGFNTSTAWSDGIDPSSQKTTCTYLGQGKLLMSSACTAGYKEPSPAYYSNDPQIFYNNNWQFVNLSKPKPTLVTGVTTKLFIEDTTFNGSNLPGYSRHRLQGVPIASGVAAGGINWSTGALFAATFPTAPARSYTLRCEGFVTAVNSATYTFLAAITANTTNGVRVWVDNRVVYENWGTSVGSTPIPLVGSQAYSLVVEMFDDDPGQATLSLQWSYPGQAMQTIPAAQLVTPTAPGFRTATWTSLIVRLDPNQLTGPSDTLKAGIMLRPGYSGLSPLLSGREAFLMLGYSPTRGIFTERRMLPSMVTQRQPASWYVGTGATLTTASTTGVFTLSAAGIIKPAPQSGTHTQNGETATISVTRRATVTPSYERAPPQYTVSSIYVSTLSDIVTPNSLTTTIDGRQVTVTYGYSKNNVWTETGFWKKTGSYTIAETTTLSSTDGLAAFDVSRHIGKRVLLFYANQSSKTTYFDTSDHIDTVTPTALTLRKRYHYIRNPTVSNSDSRTTTKVFQSFWVYSEDDPTDGHDVPYIVRRLKDLGVSAPGVKASDWVAMENGMTGPGQPQEPKFAEPVKGADPTLEPRYGTVARTFAIPEGIDSPVDIPVNSWISSSGTWFTPTQSKTMPWHSSWTAAAMTPPQTGSLNPDMWVDASPSPPLVATGDPNPYANGDRRLTRGRYNDDQPRNLPSPASQEVWLRLTKSVVRGAQIVSFSYFLGAQGTSPASSGWMNVVDSKGSPLTADITGWGANLLMGPCLQSGDKYAQATALFTDLAVNAGSAGTFNASVWDSIPGRATGSNQMTNYLASQYQVFWGPNDITEDFFAFQDSIPNGRNASEEVYVNPREFWSQSRFWEDGTEKDPLPAGKASPPNTENRQLWARSTFLTLNLGQIQNYITTRSLNQAMHPVLSSPTATATPSFSTPALSASFNGLIYAARTNRYPWNPTPGRGNPFSCNHSSLTSELPNGSTNGDVTSKTMDATVMLNGTNMGDATMFHTVGPTSFHKLQPYVAQPGGDISEAPPFKPQHFHHGVRLINGAAITWGVKSGSAFGSGKTIIITPNQLFIQGDLNTTKTSVTVPGVSGLQAKNTPLAVVGDQITFLSNAFGQSTTNLLDTSRLQGFTPYASAKEDNYLPLFLSAPTSVGQARTTTYVAAMITNNQPTTCARVREGQGAPFIDTMQYLERWGYGQRMNYIGSLVVVDSRRYTDAFLLDSPRTDGRSPFGTMGWNAYPEWDNTLAADEAPKRFTVPNVYTSPDRFMEFNRDLLTPEGTPPYTPNGVTSMGVGGWTRILK
jgi:hypothetical protein